jgi:hypothetical protein
MPTKVFEAIQTGARRLKENNCYSITLHTQELERNTAMDVLDFTNQLVKVVLSDTNINKEVIAQVEAVDLKNKERWTPSQKLRFAIRELQTRQGLEDQEPEEYYREWVTKFINHINGIDA